MALYHKWDVKKGFFYVLQFFSLISDGIGGVGYEKLQFLMFRKMRGHFLHSNTHENTDVFLPP